jgi:hypothetical protein
MTTSVPGRSVTGSSAAAARGPNLLPVARAVGWSAAAGAGYLIGSFTRSQAPELLWADAAVVVAVLIYGWFDLTDWNAWPPYHAIGLVLAYGPLRIDQTTFFEIAAQVAAGLFIALTLEVRNLGFGNPLIADLIRSVVILLLVAGIVSFAVLATGNPAAVDAQYVAAPLLGAGLILALLAVQDSDQSPT